MADWEQMEMEPPCTKCLWGSRLGDCIVDNPSIENCEWGLKMYSVAKIEEQIMNCPNCDGKGFNIVHGCEDEWIENCSACGGTGEIEERRKTNRDKLMEMSSEEIACIVDENACKICAYNENNCMDLECKNGIKEWLEAYVED